MSWTLAEARNMLAIWIDAEKAVATGQAYRIGTRQLTRANLSEISKRIEYWRKEVEALESGAGNGIKVFWGVPIDL